MTRSLLEGPPPFGHLHHVAFRSGGTLDDLRALKDALGAHDVATQIMPLRRTVQLDVARKPL